MTALYTISTTITTRDIVYDCITHHFYNHYHQGYCLWLHYTPFLQPLPPGILSMTALYIIYTTITTRDIVYDCITHHFYNHYYQGYCIWLHYTPFLQPLPPGILSMTALHTISTTITTRDIVYDCIVHHLYNHYHQGYCLWLHYTPFLQPFLPGILSMIALHTISTTITTRDIVYDCIVHHLYNHNHQGYCLWLHYTSFLQILPSGIIFIAVLYTIIYNHYHKAYCLWLHYTTFLQPVPPAILYMIALYTISTTISIRDIVYDCIIHHFYKQYHQGCGIGLHNTQFLKPVPQGILSIIDLYTISTNRATRDIVYDCITQHFYNHYHHGIWYRTAFYTISTTITHQVYVLWLHFAPFLQQ